jgi:mannose-6-phosphate isomerase
MPGGLPDILTRGPVPLAADNFTPLARTPWAGEALSKTYKRAHAPAGARIGEAWEFSCDPAFPSRVKATGQALAELIAAYPDAVLSKQQRDCQILVKLLNARDPLSLQVHPSDTDPDLAPGECGKPESWLVLDAEPGAGIYLGFARPLTKDQLRAGIAKDILHFEPVQAGDYFEIEPGVPHSIAPGVTLLEPQRVIQGQAGKTFRMWDWDRLDEGGKPRALHLEQSLKLIDPERQYGPAFAQSLRRKPERVVERDGVTATIFPANASYRTALFSAARDAEFTWAVREGFGALVMLTGEASSNGIVLKGGEPALLPAAAMPLASRLSAGTRFAVVIPATARLEFL